MTRTAILGGMLAIAACACAPDDAVKPAPRIDDLPAAAAAARVGKADSLQQPTLVGAVACGDTVEGAFAADRRYHAWTFEGRPGQTLDLDLRATDGVTDSLLALFDPRGGLIDYDDDCRPGTYDSCLDGVALPWAGRYTVLATTYGRVGRGRYALEVHCAGRGAAAGEACAQSADCAVGLGCDLGDDGGTCRAPDCGAPGDDACVNGACRPFDGGAGGPGVCARDTACDDGRAITCRRAVPVCPDGTMLAHQQGCYACVDLDTCAPPRADDGVCQPRGCSGQVCADREVVSLCDVRPVYQCLAQARCERQGEGCGWTFARGGAAHRCLLDHGFCAFDDDCGAGARCDAEGSYGSCVPDAPPPVEGGAVCGADRPCADGLRCVGAVDGEGVCRDVSARPGEGAACGADRPCGAALVCAGLAYGPQGQCVPAWMQGVFVGEAPHDIPDASADGVQVGAVVRGLATVPTDVYLTLAIEHTWRGDLRVTLTDPNGQTVVVHDRAGGSADDLRLDRVPVRGFSMDDTVNGTWTLTVQDLARQDVGALRGWSLDVTSRWD
ncbi:MAG: proprotein convertase P-domain-containing protein [Myxococcales bacterium]|nr:proprotein convertase P-domain-containing protein [Myxococcales bacterium]